MQRAIAGPPALPELPAPAPPPPVLAVAANRKKAGKQRLPTSVATQVASTATVYASTAIMLSPPGPCSAAAEQAALLFAEIDRDESGLLDVAEIGWVSHPHANHIHC